MPSQPVAAILRKAYRVSGAFREFAPFGRSLALCRFLQIADLALHWDALFLSMYLSWRLVKVFACLTRRSQTSLYSLTLGVSHLYL